VLKKKNDIIIECNKIWIKTKIYIHIDALMRCGSNFQSTRKHRREKWRIVHSKWRFRIKRFFSDTLRDCNPYSWSNPFVLERKSCFCNASLPKNGVRRNIFVYSDPSSIKSKFSPLLIHWIIEKYTKIYPVK